MSNLTSLDQMDMNRKYCHQNKMTAGVIIWRPFLIKKLKKMKENVFPRWYLLKYLSYFECGEQWLYEYLPSAFRHSANNRLNKKLNKC